MEFKVGVGIKELKPQIILAAILAERVYSKFGVSAMIVTSCNDGQHMTNSKHYTGNAVDLRTKTVGLARQLVEAIKVQLKPLGYDVIFEDEHGDNEHLHIEYDPKV